MTGATSSKLLRELHAMIREVERCKSCQGVIGALDVCHEKKYDDLWKRVNQFLAAEPS
jgi:hypothetical protein